MNSDYEIEEYKHVLDRINQNEKRRYQTLALCLGGFGIIIGFAPDGAAPVVPVALPILLFLCTREYAIQSWLQRVNSAFIVAKCEQRHTEIDHATGDKAISYGGRVAQAIANATHPMFILFILCAAASYFYMFPNPEVMAAQGKLEDTVRTVQVSSSIGFHVLCLVAVIRSVFMSYSDAEKGWREYYEKPSSGGIGQ